MTENKEFIAFVNRLKTLSPTITEEQRIGLLRQGVQEYSLTPDEADNILKTSGLIVGEQDSYFDVLGISIEELENLSEADLVAHIESVHDKLYRVSLNAGGRIRSDGRTEEQWRTLLNQARDTLLDPEIRPLHYTTLQQTETSLDNGITHLSSENMVLIPEGELQYGYVDAFYIDSFPVTNLQYKLFLDANPQWKIPKVIDIYRMRKYRDTDYLKTWIRNIYPTGKEDHPVTWVSWYAAMAYAQWLGKRLPTEAEWEKAAYGGLVGNKYPWGNSVDHSLANYNNKIGETTPIGNYPANNYDVYDMVGNVSEWCLDEFDRVLNQSSSQNNPNMVEGESVEDIIESYTESRKKRVLKGGSWYSAIKDLQIASKTISDPWKTESFIGFRCVKPINP